MFKLGELFKGAKKESAENTSSNNSGTSPIGSVRNWYEERYDTLIVQRNMLLILLGVAILIVIVSVLAAAQIATSKEFDPFVIQVDEQSGSAKVVNPLTTDILSGDEALTRYFIKRYLIARETYNPVDFESSARKTVRLLSDKNVFQFFMGFIKDKSNDPTLIYGQKNTTYLTIKSWSKLDKKKYVVRFSVSETTGSMHVYNKIAILDVDYTAMELKEDERDVNPVGFQVTGYRVDDDNS